MIVVHFKDGSKRQLSALKVAFVEGEGDKAVFRTLDDVDRIEMLGSHILPLDGKWKRAKDVKPMPVRTIVLIDEADTPVRIDVPLPLKFAQEFGAKLMSSKIEVVSRLPIGGNGSPS